MLYVGLDLSRKRLDFDARLSSGELFERGAVPPDADGLAGLVRRLGDAEVVAVIESMNGARASCTIGSSSRAGRCGSPMRSRPRGWRRWRARRTRSTPGSWPNSPAATSSPRSGSPTRRSGPNASAHASASTWSGTGPRSRPRPRDPDRPWHPQPEQRPVRRRRPTTARAPRAAGAVAVDDAGQPRPDRHAGRADRRLRAGAAPSRRPYVPLLITRPGVAWILAFTIASEIGDIDRFRTPTKLIGYTGLTPKVEQSGESDRRGPCARTAPTTSAGRSSKQPTPPAATRSTSRSSSATVPDTGASAAASSPPSRSLASSPKPSGTCSPTTNHSLRQAPEPLWPQRRPKTELRYRSDSHRTHHPETVQ